MVTEITRESWFGRIGGAVKGVVVGAILVVVAVVVLFWNEGRSVRTAKSLEEGRGAVVSVAADAVERDHEGKLVHVSAEATTDEVLKDPNFAVSARALKLRRLVEMYQWEEKEEKKTEKEVGGGTRTVTRYTYRKVWSDRSIDSSRFHEKAGHENPGTMPVRSNEVVASRVSFGAFELPRNLVDRIDAWSAVSVEAPPAGTPGNEVSAEPFRVIEGGYYRGLDPSKPAIGDVQIRFQIVRPQAVSVVARQAGQSFAPYQTEAGDALLLLEVGSKTADQMFQEAIEDNVVLTWVLRVVGLVVLAIAFSMILRPLVVVADVLPLAGDLLGLGVGLFSFAAALAVSFVTIAAAWILYRPIVAVGLLVVAGAGLGLFFFLARSRKRSGPG